MGATSAAISFTLGAALGSSYNNTFSSAKAKAAELGSAFGKVNKQLAAVDEYRASTKALEKIKQLQQTSTVSSDKLSNAYDIVSDKVRKSTEALGKYKISLNDIGKTQEELRKKSEKLALQLESRNRIKQGASQMKSGWLGATATAAGIAAVVNPAADFEQSMANVRSVTNATDSDFAKLGDTAKSLGKSTIFGANGAAQGMEALARQGFKTNQIVSAMPSVLDLAAAANIDVATSANITADVLDGFNLSAQETSRVTDLLAKAITKTDINTNELGSALKSVASIANATGVSIEESTAVIMKLSDAGMEATTAGGSLKKMLSNIASPASAGANAFEELGIETRDAAGNMRPVFEILKELDDATRDLGEAEKAEIMDKIFGDRAMGGMLSILGKTSDMKALTKELENSAGAAKKMADIRTGTFQGQLKMLTSALSDVGITIGSVLLPPLTVVVKTIALATSWVGAFAQKFPTFTSVVVLGATAWLTYAKILPMVGGLFKVVTGALMPMLPLLKTLFPIVISGIRSVGLAIMANPLGAVLAALTIGAALLIAYWEPVSEFFVSVWDKIKAPFVDAWGFIKNVFAFSPLGMVVTMWEPAIKWITDKIEWIGAVWNEVKSWFGFGEEEAPAVGSAMTSPMQDIENSYKADAKEGFSSEAPKGSLWNSMFGGEERDQMTEAKNKARETIEQSSVSNKKTIQDNRRSEYQINIQAQPGQDQKELAEAVMREIEKKEQKASRGALYDNYNYA